jgi:hypothetical protein
MHNLESGLDGVSLAQQQTRTFWILNDNYDVMFEAGESVCWKTSIVLVTVRGTTFLAAAGWGSYFHQDEADDEALQNENHS